jgi:hypothetical protein
LLGPVYVISTIDVLVPYHTSGKFPIPSFIVSDNVGSPFLADLKHRFMRDLIVDRTAPFP